MIGRTVVASLVVCLFILCQQPTATAYHITQHFYGNSFFNNFDFFTAGDPTHGYVNYVNQSNAQSQGYIQVRGNSVYIGTDMKRVASGRGRDSVRLTSKVKWQNGLFIFDASHMPTGCATWPAWWLVGPNWPNGGEIDIIEGINTNNFDSTTLHTSQGCDMSGESTSLFTGKWGTGPGGKLATNCWVNAPGEYANQGCGIVTPGGTYGAPFNSAGGGVYVLEWTGTYIQAFFFPRSGIPGDITSGNPNPQGWGKPYAYFQLGQHCPNVHFEDLAMVINLTYCGDWAGASFNGPCAGLGSCNSFVQNNPGRFTESYWLINYISVYQN